MKKISSSILLASTLTGFLVVSSNVMAFGIPGLPFGGDDKKAESSSSKKSTNGCVDRSAGGEVSFFDNLKKEAIETVMNSALKSIVKVESLKLPKKINNTCVADQRLKYVKKMNNSLNTSIQVAMKDVAKCYGLHDIEKQIESKLLDASEKADVELELKSIDSIANSISENKDKQKIKCSAGATGALKGLAGYAGTVVGWEKELLEFGKDNMKWSINNVSAVKSMASTAKNTSEGVITIGKSVVQPLWVAMTPYDKTKAKKMAKKAEKDKKKISKKVEAETDEL